MELSKTIAVSMMLGSYVKEARRMTKRLRAITEERVTQRYIISDDELSSPVELFDYYYPDTLTVSNGMYLYNQQPITLARIYAMVNEQRITYGKEPIYVPDFFRQKNG